MKIVVACPSYKRPRVESLDYLSFVKVYVCETEYEDYVKANPKHVENIVPCKKGIQGNLCRIRNHILDTEFANGADAVCLIDDDLKFIGRFEVQGMYGYDNHIVTEDEFLDWLEYYTIMCDELGYKLWGVNCNSDALSYRHYSPLCLTAYIGGPFSVHLPNPLRYDENLPLKEDYDLTLQHCNKYRGTLRVQKYHYNCKQSKQKGGCATYRNMNREREQFELLQKKWGEEIVRYDGGKRSGSEKEKMFDYNPIIKIPIKGI